VWIGKSVTIMSGVKIGDGSVIASNSVITKDIPPYSIVGGNPSKHIKYRFNSEQIYKLLTIKWWDWEDEKIKSNINLLFSEEINDFLDKHYRIT
jgi:serine acetyltransferase